MTEDFTKQPTTQKTAAAKPAVDSISITPASATISPGKQQQFHATVVSDSSATSTDVIWSVEPPAGAGTIGPRGLYTAPTGRAGSAKVVATSVADPAKSASASVTY